MRQKFIYTLAVFFIAGLILLSGCTQNVEKNQEKTNDKISVCDITKNPQQYLNQPIKTEATLKFIGESYMTQKGEFILQEDDCQLDVNSWLPLEVPPCSPDVKDCKIPTMATYLDKKLSLTGVLAEQPKTEYINGKWTVVGNHYVLTGIKDIIIIP